MDLLAWWNKGFRPLSLSFYVISYLQFWFCFGEFGSLSLLEMFPIPSALATVFSSEAKLGLQLANLQYKHRNKEQ